MPNNFKPGDKVTVHHQQGDRTWATHKGTIVEHVKDKVWRVDLMGLRMLWPEDYMEADDAVESGDAQVQSGQA